MFHSYCEIINSLGYVGNCAHRGFENMAAVLRPAQTTVRLRDRRRAAVMRSTSIFRCHSVSLLYGSLLGWVMSVGHVIPTLNCTSRLLLSKDLQAWRPLSRRRMWSRRGPIINGLYSQPFQHFCQRKMIPPELLALNGACHSIGCWKRSQLV